MRILRIKRQQQRQHTTKIAEANSLQSIYLICKNHQQYTIMLERMPSDSNNSTESLEGGRRQAKRPQSPTTNAAPQVEAEASRTGHTNRRSLLERQQGRQRVASTYFYTNDHCGNTQHYETYSFWTSKPALAAFCFLLLAIRFRRIQFLFGALLVFTYEVAVVLAKWSGFILHHPSVEDG